MVSLCGLFFIVIIDLPCWSVVMVDWVCVCIILNDFWYVDGDVVKVGWVCVCGFVLVDGCVSAIVLGRVLWIFRYLLIFCGWS